MIDAKKVMTRELETAAPEDSIQSAAAKMKERDVGMLPVITPEGRAVGTITDRDIAVGAVAEGNTPGETKVLEVMTPGIEFCYEDDNIEQLARHMGGKKLRRLVVINRDTKGIKGVISLGDIAFRCGEKHIAGSVLAKCVAV